MNKLHCTSTLPLCTIARVLRRIDHTHTRHFDFNTRLWSMIKGSFHEKNIPQKFKFYGSNILYNSTPGFLIMEIFFSYHDISIVVEYAEFYMNTFFTILITCRTKLYVHVYIYHFISIKFWIMGEKFRVKWPWRLSKGLCSSFAALALHCSHMMQNIKIPFLIWEFPLGRKDGHKAIFPSQWEFPYW